MSALNQARSLTRRFQARLRVEELESRTLLSVAYTPAQILTAYGINQIAFSNGAIKGDGSGQTIAIVDAYYDPTIQSDLATFSSKYGLPQLDGKNGDATFTQIDLSNRTLSPAGNDWTVETALDVEWAHAVAPKAKIVLVEAASDLQNASTGEPTDLLNAVKTAATYPGVGVVSMSWGIGEVPKETNWDSYFSTPGVTFVAASGDSGAGTIWPAVSPNVVSVGGTTLNLTKSNTIASETGWGYGLWSSYFGGSGGGFSQYESLPSYQASAGISKLYTQFGVRLSPDVAYVADPNTGLYVYDGVDGGWGVVGGTSAGAPQWAALIAIADQGRALAKQAPLSSTQTLNALYSNQADFHDITRGSTGAYYIVNSSGNIVGEIPVTAGKGYDLVTGLGTPIANLLVPALAGVTSSTPKVVAASSSSSSSSGTSGSSNGGRSQHFDVTGISESVAVSLLAQNSQTANVLGGGQIANSASFSRSAPAAAPMPIDGGRASTSTLTTTANGSGSSVDDASLPDKPVTNVPHSQPLPSAPVVVPDASSPAPIPETPTPGKTNGVLLGPNSIDALFIQEENDGETAREAVVSDAASATVDLASFLGAAAVLTLGLHPSRRWTSRNLEHAEHASRFRIAPDEDR